MEQIILFAYIACLSILFVFGSHGFLMIYYYLKSRHRGDDPAREITDYPVVSVQLPIYNELYVVERLIYAAVAMVYLTGVPSLLSAAAGSFMTENIRPEYFVLVIGIYLIELVVFLTRFTNGLSEGDDTASFMYALGKTMPVSIMVFSVTVILGQYFFLQLVP